MKQGLFIMFLLAAAGLESNAQTEQGNFLAGGNLQLNTASKNTQITINPMLGYFFVDNFAGGATLDLSYAKIGTSPNASKYTTFGIGPFVRYYVGSENVRPFLDAAISFTSTKTKIGSETSTTSTGSDFFVGPGVALFLNRNVALEGLAGYEHTAFKDQKGSGGFAFKLGFQVYLNRAQVAAVTNTVK